jgi:8-oxo-dGTP diphosphatase
MEEIKRFNARCYAFIVSTQNKVLVMNERWKGADLQKLPGGGLELGEGMIECLEAWQPLTWKHHYVPTHCFTSQFRPDEQLILNYFLADQRVEQSQWRIIPEDENLLGMQWLPLENASAQWFTLESDRDAFTKLVEALKV